MPRKKRATSPASEAIPESIRVYNTGLYGRLSVLDNGKADGDSLESQIDLMERYLGEHSELRYCGLYQDNGFTGTNFDRPGWDALLQDAAAGKINCIVVKDLSRLGRNYIETGEFLEKVCPRLGVRFISINDGYDSASLNATEELTAALKNIINDYYAKDISRKVCSALAAKRSRGEYIGSYAPYGYQKDPADKNHLLIDPATAPIVCRIYQWRAAGDGYETIARKLNRQDIPSPGRYRYQQGIVTNNNKKGEALLWNRHVLRDILHNPVYIGHLIQGKCRASLYSSISAHAVPESEWDVSRHTHEAILSEELFNAVQQVNQQRTAACKAACGRYSNLPKESNPYRGKLVCADCGTQLKLYRSLSRDRTQGYYSYICPTYEEHRELRCTKKSIRSSVLDAAVLSALRVQMDLFLNSKAVLETLLQRERQICRRDNAGTKRSELERQIERRVSLSVSLYSDWKNGILTRDEYSFAKNQYEQELTSLRQMLGELQAPALRSRHVLSRAEEWAEKISRLAAADTVTTELVDAFITRIRLDSASNIHIQFCFEDDRHLIEAEIKRLREEAA